MTCKLSETWPSKKTCFFQHLFSCYVKSFVFYTLEFSSFVKWITLWNRNVTISPSSRVSENGFFHISLFGWGQKELLAKQGGSGYHFFFSMTRDETDNQPISQHSITRPLGHFCMSGIPKVNLMFVHTCPHRPQSPWPLTADNWTTGTHIHNWRPQNDMAWYKIWFSILWSVWVPLRLSN